MSAAERVFALFGYEGATMRRIAEEAGVAQALLHYHFENKNNLYAAVFQRRSESINRQREELLRELFTRPKAPALEDVLSIFVFSAEPASLENQRDYNMFQQLVSANTVANDARSNALIARYYDPIAKAFIDALQRVVPALSKESAVWAYLFALGARMQASAPPARAARLSGNLSANRETVLKLLIPFIAAGIRALPHQPHSQLPRSSEGTKRGTKGRRLRVVK